VNGLLENISAELIAASIAFVLGGLGSRIPRSVDRHRFGGFWGEPMLANDFRVVYGMMSQSPPGEQRFQKKHHDGRITEFQATRQIITQEVIRACSYILQETAKFVNKPVTICTDEDTFNDLDSTFIAIGGPVVNEITERALNEESNKFLQFSIPDDPAVRVWKIYTMVGLEDRRSFARTLHEGKDYGVILKVGNSRFPRHRFFVCAGLGSWGTSGAAWYLSNHWRALYKEFGSGEFGLVVEVDSGSDTSAIRVFP
jgi:hypothetical protein